MNILETRKLVNGFYYRSALTCSYFSPAVYINKEKHVYIKQCTAIGKLDVTGRPQVLVIGFCRGIIVPGNKREMSNMNCSAGRCPFFYLCVL